MLEANIEKFLVAEVKRRNGVAVKLNPTGLKGIPDRLVILQDRVVFVELKRPVGGYAARLQRWWLRRLADLGHEAIIAATQAEVLDLLDNPR